jgi:tellurite resistance protein TerC
MIGAGVALIARFHWVMYIFGAFLVITGVRMAMRGEESDDPETNPVLVFIRRVIPVWPHYDGDRFFHRGPDARGVVRTMATPLFVVLLLIEIMDLVFAVDSIPAVFSITQDPFLVYTSNVCAILGLRSLYFLIADMMHRFRYLKYGLSAVLAFVGAKMLASIWYELSILASLAVISFILAGSVLASLILSRGEA